MQVRKVAVVATGALATAAAMGSTPAFAADGGAVGTPEVAPAAVGVLGNEGVNRASDEAMRDLAEQWLAVTPEQAWSAPWEQEPPQILSLGSGSALSVAPWQHCGSNGPWVLGATVPIASPATVLGDCKNGNIDIKGNGGDDALLSILDNTAISALSWQMCGSNGVGALGVNVPVASPATVAGDCKNGNITIDTEKDKDRDRDRDWDRDGKDKGKYHDHDHDRDHKGTYYQDLKVDEQPDYPYHKYEPVEAGTETAAVAGAGAEIESTVAPETEGARAEQGWSAPWEQEPPQILSAGSGSALSLAPWQHCGSNGPWAVGVTVPVASPATVLGDCKNGNIDINGDGGDALFSLLDNTAVSVAAFQMCGSNGVGAVGVNVPVASPATVTGDCKNGNIKIG